MIQPANMQHTNTDVTPHTSAAWRGSLLTLARRIPFYREHLADADGRDFAAVPTFDKSMTASYGRFPISAGSAAGAHRVLATSGTSGQRMYVSFDAQEWQRTGTWLERVGRAAGVTSADVLLNTHCYGLWVGGPALDLLANRCGAGLVPLGPVNPSLVLELLADGVGTAISATPSYLRRLVETAQERRFDIRSTPLRVGFIGAEPAETSFRQKLLAQLPDGFQWIELYGLTETGGPSVACAPDPNLAELMLNTDEFLIEVLDPIVDRPVPFGTVGELTITTRRPDGRTPLVRYRTRDLVRATAGEMDAPTRISRIVGRSDQSLKIGGVLVYPSAAAEIMAELLPPTAEWRAIVTRKHEDDELLIEAEASRDVCDLVAQVFRERIGVALTVNSMHAGAFARSREKTQRILIASPSTVTSA
jgi:phenylacetate-CoA ligase